jgi:hypothetical protein
VSVDNGTPFAEQILREQLAEAREAWTALTPHLPAEWDGGDLGYLVSDMDVALATRSGDTT